MTATSEYTEVVVEDLRVEYGTGALAIDGVSCSAAEGEVLAILGRNGAGKSTLVRALANWHYGINWRIGGRMAMRSRSASGETTEIAIDRKSAILVPEREKVFPSLTVREHFELVGIAVEKRALVFEELEPLLGRRAGVLSGGERQMVALEMAFARRTKLLLIDELSLGLAPIAVRKLLQEVRRYTAEHRCITIVVEQDARAAIGVADKVGVLEHGKLVWFGDHKRAESTDLLGLYFGTARHAS